jgi:hypothetical protein
MGQAWGIRGLGGVDVIDDVVDGIVDDSVVTAFASISISFLILADPDMASTACGFSGNRVRNLAQGRLRIDRRCGHRNRYRNS